jgi:hypothetical protein
LAYVRQLFESLKTGGHVVIATFGPEGPEKCSGIVTTRYNAESLKRELGQDFRLVRSSVVEHQAPFETVQKFLYCHFTLGSLGAMSPQGYEKFLAAFLTLPHAL